ncbi:MAG: hypothetical protein ABSG79_20200 [Bryobacteraceae bacterium]|jgi:uncharacterized protein (TIGR03437 family)
MKRNLGFCLALICLYAGRAAGQCSSAPASLSAMCNQIEGDLDSFNTAVSAGWNGVKTPVAFGTEVTTADCNRGPATLLAPGTFSQVLIQLNAFALVGVQSVTTCIGFPLLYEPFYEYNNDPQDYPKIVAFYQSFVSEAHKRGLKVVIETSVLFPSVATDLPLTKYYATLSEAEVTAGRGQNALTIAQQVQPDYLNLGSEPDTQAALLGLSAEYTPQEYATEIATITSQLRAAGINGKPLIGAGIGNWQTDGSSYLQALLNAGTDYIDLHIYSANLSFLPLTVTYLDTARAAGKGVAISEAWLKKVTDSQMQGSEFAIIQALSADPYDNFSFWEPLDSEFLGELVKLSYWKNLYYLSPFSDDWFFAYLDYDQYGNDTTDQQTTAINAAASAAMRAGQLSAVGQSYAAAIGPMSWPVTVSAASDTTPVAPGSIVSIYGSNLASTAAEATSVPLPFTLGGASVTVTDNNGSQAAMPLFYAGPQQINAQIPEGVNTGPAVLTIATPSGGIESTVMLATVAPGLISANGDGKGAAAAQVVTSHADGTQSLAYAYNYPCAPGTCTTAPINLGSPSDQTALVLYGTGIRNRAALSDVTVEIGTQSLPAFYAGAAPTFVGLDQVNVMLPHSLAGSGTVSLSVSVAGTTSNLLTATFQ